jgi:hypothetical protein
LLLCSCAISSGRPLTAWMKATGVRAEPSSASSSAAASRCAPAFARLG